MSLTESQVGDPYERLKVHKTLLLQNTGAAKESIQLCDVASDDKAASDKGDGS